jgi:hypothetical protein
MSDDEEYWLLLVALMLAVLLAVGWFLLGREVGA